MKKVLITGGPTNEYIDEVMKITNMSSGKIAIDLANIFAENGYDTTLLLTKTIRHPLVDNISSFKNCSVMRFETTKELYEILEGLSDVEHDIIIHSAAVADYKPEFSFRLEDMADEIAQYVHHHRDCHVDTIANDILHIMQNPQCKVDDDTKISSVEPNLTVKLGLTPKIIKNLRSWFPNAYICGFKLLENVSEQELVDAAMKQLKSCNTNLVFANDLAELRKGNMARLVVSQNKYNNIKVNGAEGIYRLLDILSKNTFSEVQS